MTRGWNGVLTARFHRHSLNGFALIFFSTSFQKILVCLELLFIVSTNKSKKEEKRQKNMQLHLTCFFRCLLLLLFPKVKQKREEIKTKKEKRNPQVLHQKLVAFYLILCYSIYCLLFLLLFQKTMSWRFRTMASNHELLKQRIAFSIIQRWRRDGEDRFACHEIERKKCLKVKWSKKLRFGWFEKVEGILVTENVKLLSF